MTDPVRRWHGRPLPRPHEDVVDQGLAFDLRTALDRRLLLRGLGAGALAAGLAACGGEESADPRARRSPSGAPSTTTGATGEIPDETAGPYPGDGSNGPDVLERSGIVRSDIRSSLGGGATAEGVPMTLELTIRDLSKGGGGAAYSGVAVYVWHCDREGRYSMYSQGVADQTYLRGVQVAGADGTVRFTSVFPACYAGRWPHLHFEVYPGVGSITDHTTALATSQVALPEAVCRTVYAEPGYTQSVRNLQGVSLSDDNVFGEDDGRLQLGTVTGSVAAGYRVRLTAAVDPRTTPTGGGAPPGSDGRPRGARPSGGPGGGPGGPPRDGGPGGPGDSPPPSR